MFSSTTPTLRSLASSTSSLSSSSVVARRSLSVSPALGYPRGPMNPMFIPARLGQGPYVPKETQPYPSPLNGPPKQYKKEQRAPWQGPESDEPMSGIQRIDTNAMHMNPEHPMYKVNPDAKPSSWYVRRTQAGDYLPVYVEYVNADKSQIRTLIRHIEGDADRLLDNILHHLVEVRPGKVRAQGRVIRTSGQIELKGNWKKVMIEFLLSRGM